MNLRFDVRVVGMVCGVVGAFYVFPLTLAFFRDEPTQPFLSSLIVAAALFGASMLLTRGANRELSKRDGFLVVVISWLFASGLAALPYVFAGELSGVDAWFEAVSGITTTGSTILTDIEALPRSTLLWRSLTQWIGGMGIILFAIAVLPLLGVGGMQLFRAEVPGPVKDKLAPRLIVTARYLWFIYVGLTALEFVLLNVAGMGWLDALDHSLTTMATGGFSPRNASLGAYDSLWIRGIVMMFMFLAGMNFVLHVRLVRGNLRAVIENEEWRWYVSLLAVFTILIWIQLGASGLPPGEALADTLFSVVSLVTTTGFATADFELWPTVTHGLIVVALVFGGMAGSTSGGVKTLRTLVAFRSLRMSFRKLLHPHAANPVVYGSRAVDSNVVNMIWGFFAAFVTLWIAGMLVLNLAGADLVTAGTASLTAVANVGPGLGDVGPTDNFANFTVTGKLALTFLMLCGRLEIYTVLILLIPAFWRR